MKSQRNLKSKHRAFEQLENRQLLAGNVVSLQSGDQLVLNGDTKANILTITQSSNGDIKVTGSATKIDGLNSETFSGITNLFINTAGGNDVLTIKGVTLTGDTGEIGLGIILGPGIDTLVMSGLNVTYQTAISGGDKNAMVIDKCNFNCDLGIEGGEGVDAVTITRTNIDGALSIDLLDGTNALTMVTVSVNAIEGGGSYPYETLPEGFENLPEILPSIDCGAQIEGGSGVDAIAMVSVQIDCETEINTFGGVDAVTITNSRFGDAPVLEEVAPSDVPIKQIGSETSGLCIETGVGNDAVTINATTVYGFLQIDTSGDYCCPTDELCSIEIGQPTPLQTESSGKDGIDAVVLNNVQVLQSEEGLCLENWCECVETINPNILTDGIDGGTPCWFQCCCDMSVLESGMLIIYTGNQTDSVVLNKVTTGAEAAIYTTDESSLDGADAVAITNSSFNQNGEVMKFALLPLIETNDGLAVETGCGNDAVSIAKTKVVGKTFIDTGAGTDVVALAFLTSDDLCVQMDGGSHDVLTVSNTTVYNDAVFADDANTGGVLNYKHLNNHFAPNQPQVYGFDTVV